MARISSVECQNEFFNRSFYPVVFTDALRVQLIRPFSLCTFPSSRFDPMLVSCFLWLDFFIFSLRQKSSKLCPIENWASYIRCGIENFSSNERAQFLWILLLQKCLRDFWKNYIAINLKKCMQERIIRQLIDIEIFLSVTSKDILQKMTLSLR